MVSGFVELPGGSGYSLTYANRNVTSGGDGSYEIVGAPAGTYLLTATKDGFTQPCARSVTLGGADATQDIELLTDDDVAAGLLPEPGGNTISGRITHNGMPVQGAYVAIEGFVDLVVAQTRSDSGGHYILCGLWNGRFEVFASTSIGLSFDQLADLNGNLSIDIAMNDPMMMP